MIDKIIDFLGELFVYEAGIGFIPKTGFPILIPVAETERMQLYDGVHTNAFIY